MRKPVKRLILNALGFSIILLTSACGEKPIQEPIPVEVRTIEVAKAAPIVPPVDLLKLKEAKWIIVTPDNVDDVFKNVDSKDTVLFALTADGYQNLIINLSDLRTVLEQQQKVIAIYEESFE